MSIAKAPGWDAVSSYAERLLQPTFGRPTTATALALHPTRDAVAACSEVRTSLSAPAKPFVTVFEGGRVTCLREGWLPVWSPDGSTLAHLDSNGVQIGDFHRALDARPERLAWNADGTALLLVVAESGSELGSVAGSGFARADGDDSWLPNVEGDPDQLGWRRAIVVDVATGALRTISRNDLNVWNACWAGDRVLALCSDGDPSESAWYTADLRLLDAATGADEIVARPRAQVGAITASLSGRLLAWVDAVCSDRDLAAGDLQLLDLDNPDVRRLAAPVDVSDVTFVSENDLGFAGLVGMTTRIGFVSTTDDVRVVWQSEAESAAGSNPTASFRPGAAAFLRVGHGVEPAVVLAGGTGVDVVGPLLPAGVITRLPGTARVHRWHAPDGLEIEGWLHLPDGVGPHPLVVLIHGGPVACSRATWSATAFARQLLLERGYALLLPNPRGSSGRGQEFASAVVGDMGGADALDITSGVVSLIEAGVVDPARVGVTGGSYGGYMTAWLVTQTTMFAAAVAQHPVTDWAQQHGASSIPLWDELFLDGKPYATDGHYVARSPITHAAQVQTPTLFIAGTLDRATPPGQALTMQRALAAHGVPSECVTYPLVGHGARDLPSILDVTARTLDWFARWMPN